MEPSPKKQKTEGNEKADLTVEDTCKILEAFSREQLMEVVQEAATKHSNVLDLVRSIADENPEQRKLFVRGLHWDTNTESLMAFFSQFGELEEGFVILDKRTRKSKGYGFVTFKHIDGALKALEEPNKEIDGRMTVTNLASAGSDRSPPRAERYYRRNPMRNDLNHHGLPQPSPSGVYPGGHLNNHQGVNQPMFFSGGPILQAPQSGIGGFGGQALYGAPQFWGFGESDATGVVGSTNVAHRATLDGPPHQRLG